jgi:hypothetical protein
MQNEMHSMSSVSKLLGVVCVLLTAVLWVVTIADPGPAPVAAALALTGIVAMMLIFTLSE